MNGGGRKRIMEKGEVEQRMDEEEKVKPSHQF